MKSAVEHLRGNGHLVLGERFSPNESYAIQILNVSYAIQILEKFVEAGLQRPPRPGRKEIVGQIGGLSANALWDLRDQDVTLILEDRRRLRCQVTLGARILPRGELS
jgi:hypothetical protein